MSAIFELAKLITREHVHGRVTMFEVETVAMQSVHSLPMSSASDRQRATDLWDAIRAFRKQAEAQKETVCRPLKTAWDEAKAPYDEFVAECQDNERTLQTLMSRWDQAQLALARAKQAKIQASIDARNANAVARAETKGGEVVLRVAPVVQAPPTSIKTQAGTTQRRSTKKVYTIKLSRDSVPAQAWNATHVEVAQLLTDYPQLFVLDRAKFNQLAKSGVLDEHPNVSSEDVCVYSQR